ncbi:MAG: S1 RNA-binding domain-containing protein [Oscillospiraceae bacterium]|nr:S1 RNA-binding domain-containing protein [Oscillospiraceae bacterium]
MELTVGAILEGKVKSITKFGAFVELPENKSGLVHISEITHAFVNDIREHLTEGQAVKVMVIGLDNGKIDLSIRRTQSAPQRPPRGDRSAQNGARPRQDGFKPRQQTYTPPAEKAPQSFDDMLKQFMADSDSKMSGIKQYAERKTRNRRK